MIAPATLRRSFLKPSFRSAPPSPCLNDGRLIIRNTFLYDIGCYLGSRALEPPRLTGLVTIVGLCPQLIPVSSQSRSINNTTLNRQKPTVTCGIAEIFVIVCRSHENATTRIVLYDRAVRWSKAVYASGDKALDRLSFYLSDRRQLGQFNKPGSYGLHPAVFVAGNDGSLAVPVAAENAKSRRLTDALLAFQDQHGIYLTARATSASICRDHPASAD